MPVVTPQPPFIERGCPLVQLCQARIEHSEESGMHADARTIIAASLQTSCLSASVALVSSKSSQTEPTGGSAGMLMWFCQRQNASLTATDTLEKSADAGLV